MYETIEQPLGTYPVEMKCSRCPAMIHTFTEANLSDPATQELVGRFSKMALCAECHAKSQSKSEQARVRVLVRDWAAICPLDFRNTKRHLLPSPTTFDKVMGWQFGSKGLLLWGPSGKGKSRSAWEVLKREHLARRTVGAIGYKFGMEYSHKMSISSTEAFNWIEELLKVDVLLLDDVMKVRLENSGAETALFAIISDRTERQAPMIITTQDTGESLEGRMSSDRGKAMIRRLREFCEPIRFA